ncbi:MAG: hypothetical protein RTV72_09755 [Candidatus Thorarchaeota archaeon]
MMPERDASSQVLTLIIEKMNEEDRKQVDPFIPEIEEHIQQRLAEVHPRRTTRRKMEAVRAAAAYDAFLMFENRTKVRMRTPMMAKALGVPVPRINTTWKVLFDVRVMIDRSRLERIYTTDESAGERVSMVIQTLMRALEENTKESEEWFSEIEKEAISLVEQVNHEGHHPDVVAGAAVYGAIKYDTNIPAAHIAQRDVAYACCYSSAMISKVWLDLFNEGSISGSV